MPLVVLGVGVWVEVESSKVNGDRKDIYSLMYSFVQTGPGPAESLCRMPMTMTADSLNRVVSNS